MKRILVADDEALIRRLVCDFLKNSGYETVEAIDGNSVVLTIDETIQSIIEKYKADPYSV